jgi:predicted metal-binding membrane protein
VDNGQGRGWSRTEIWLPALLLGLAGLGWWWSMVSAAGMRGDPMPMDTESTMPLAAFLVAWVAMMAAMMLPGAAPAVLRHAHAGGARAVPLFAGSYLAIWALAGVVAYALDRPHGSLAAGAVVIAAGVYELTPVKRHFRRRCREDAGSGLGFGLCCVGSTIGLMAMLVALDMMSLFWMSVVAVLACVQKLLPAKAAIDVPLALVLVGLGFVIVSAPSLVPGLTPPTM